MSAGKSLQTEINFELFKYLYCDYSNIWFCVTQLIKNFFLALRPNAGDDLLILEVFFLEHTTTHHIR
jgi:hypothetical protein